MRVGWAWAALVGLTSLMAACSSSPKPLAEYTRYNTTQRYNDAADYVAWLKANRFTHGELDGLPPVAIIYHGNPLPILHALGYTPAEWGRTLQLGSTDPEELYVVRPKGGKPFIVARGLPGAGGIATQAAELIALGVRDVIHIGTSGALGNDLSASEVVLSTGAYKDGAAVLLSLSRQVSRVSEPDAQLGALCGEQLTREHGKWGKAAGYTIPIYYDQPAGLIQSLLVSSDFRNPRPLYLEMEEAPFFETARIHHVHAASLTVPADRYTVEGGKLVHRFLSDEAADNSLKRAFRAAIDALARRE